MENFLRKIIQLHVFCLSKFLKSNFKRFLILAKTAVLRIFYRFNIINTIRELKVLSIKHGPYFFAYAICIELLEDVAIPAVLYMLGKPHFIPAALAFHCEPIAYPMYFAVISLIKKFR